MDRHRVILLTGCASGIGRHLVGAFAARGFRVLATDLRLDALEEASTQEGWSASHVLLHGLDVRDAKGWEEALARVLDAFGQLDLLFHVAGYLQPGYLMETPLEDIQRHLDINACGVMLGTRIIAPHLVRQGHGHILVVGSLAGIAPIPGIALYSASKFAVRGYTLALAQELRPRGVAVTLLSPDAVQTPMLDLQVDHDAAALTFSGPRPLTVEDIAQAVFEEALSDRPLEIVLPRHRGWLARLGGAVPASAAGLLPLLRELGRRRQAGRRRRDP